MNYISEKFTAADLKLIMKDSDAKESYETIKILSEDFKVSDETAAELDVFLNNWLKANKPKTKTKTDPQTLPKRKFQVGDLVVLTYDKDKEVLTVMENQRYDYDLKEYFYFVENQNGTGISEKESKLKKANRPKPKFKKGDIVAWRNRKDKKFHGEYTVGSGSVWVPNQNDYEYDVYEMPHGNQSFAWEKDLKKVTKSKTKTKSKTTGSKSKEQVIKELLEQLENSGEQINIDQVTTIVNNIVKNHKVCYDNLCDDVVKAIKDSRNVTLTIPSLPSKNFKNDIPNLLRIIDDVLLGNNVMLIGGAGTGKTYLAEKVASVIGSETETINCNQFTSPIEINGGQTIEGYQEGKLIKAWSEGKLLILDELPKLDPNTAGILNEALAKTNLDEKDKRATITNTRGDVFKKKQGFGVIATGNVYPNTESSSYGANNKQDLSLLDRFGGSVYEIEKNPDFEKKAILPGHLFLWAIADKMRSLIEKNKWEAQVSIRLMETSLRVYLAEMATLKKGESMEDRKTYKDVIDSFIWTFTEVQQIEIKREIKYSTLFEKYQYRKLDINKNPL